MNGSRTLRRALEGVLIMSNASRNTGAGLGRAIILATLIGLAGVVPGWCWGPTAHTIITEHAIELLPPEIKPFYVTNSRYVVALTMLPDDWRHTHKPEIDNHHFIDLDLLDRPPFEGLIADRKTVESRYGSDEVAKAGILPWVIEERYGKLVEAFRKGDAVETVVQSALLAHFVGDAHVPFHATQHYDGRTSEQKGIHFRWEENLVALTLKPESIKPASGVPVDDILKCAFGWCISSYGHLDAIYRAEDKARETDPGRGYRYFRTLSIETGGILTGQITRAAEAVAGAYAAAWRAAGSPALPDKAAPLFWGH